MKRPRAPLFLTRRSYRRRRMRDAARMLPIFGAFLVILPILWEPAEGHPGRATAADGIYLFLIWAGMILIAALMARGLADRAPDEPADQPFGDED